MRGWFRSALPYLLLTPGVVYLLALIFVMHRPSDAALERLYWEYAGRILHRNVTDGFPEWVHHRAGDLRPPTGSAPGPRRLAPYTDFSCEYPPGALLMFTAFRVAFDDLESYRVSFYLAMASCQVATAVLLLRAMNDPRAAAVCGLGFTLWVVLVGNFCVSRFDAVVTLIATVGMLAWRRSRPGFAAVLLGFGGAIKLWPALLVPLVAALRPDDVRPATWSFRAAALTCVAGLLGFAAPHLLFLALGTAPSDSLGYLRYMRERPPEIESVLASVLALRHLAGLGEATPNYDFGAQNIVAAGWLPLSQAFLLAFAAAYLAIVAVSTRRKGTLQGLASVCGLVVFLTVASSKVFSGEYLIWFFPFCLLALSDRRWAPPACYVLALLFLRAAFKRWDAVTTLQPIGTILIALKNASFLAMGGFLARDAWVNCRPISPPRREQTAGARPSDIHP